MKKELTIYLRKLFIFLISFLSIVCLPLVTQALTEKSKNEIVIFVVDTSLSMVEKNALPIKRVKDFMKEYLEKSEIGDQIVIIAFDEEVKLQKEKEIETHNEIKNISKSIDEIKPVGQWTWIRYALENLKQKIRDLKNKYPEKRMTIYFLTDGKDDPPPKIKEQRRSLKDLLIDHFRDFEEKDTYIYVLYSDPEALTPEEREEVSKETPITPKEIPQEGAIHRVIELEPSEINLGSIARGVSTLKGEMIITKLVNAKGEAVELSLSSEEPPLTPESHLMQSFPLPKGTTISPESFAAESEGQRISLTFSFQRPLSDGHYQGFLKLESPVDIIPSKVKISFKVVKDTGKKIYIGPSKFVLGKLDLTQGKEEKKFLKIKKLVNIQGETIHLSSSLPGVEISPSTIQCDAEGEKEVVISLSPDLSPGKRQADIDIASDNPEVIIFPQKINVSFVVRDKNGGNGNNGDGWFKKLLTLLGKTSLFLVILLALWIVWTSLLRNKTLWIKREDTQKVKEVKIKGWVKSHLEGIGLPDYYLRFQKLWLGIILGNEKEKRERKIKYQKVFDFKMSDGETVNIVFSDKPFSKVSEKLDRE